MSPTRPLLAALLCLAASGTALADARSDLHAAFGKTLAAKELPRHHDRPGHRQTGVHGRVPGPDRYRISAPGPPRQRDRRRLHVTSRQRPVHEGAASPAGMMDQ